MNDSNHPPSSVASSWDFIVVGGGSAGCVAAGVLAKNPQLKILVLECGPAADENPETLTASGYKTAFMNDDVIWERFTEKQENAGGQFLFVGSGTGMGGSGAVNAMVYTRGSREDYDDWPVGWQWDDVVPHFEAVEEKLQPSRRPPTGFTEVALEASREAGFAISEDLNDGNMSGVMGYEWMNFQDDERRHSYTAFLREPSPGNVQVETGARVQRLEFDDERRVCAVVYERDGEEQRVGVEQEVLMCAGTLETPKLLMLSGVGPSEELASHDIDVVCANEEVGQNLHDHPNVPLFFRGDRDVDLYHPQVYGFDQVDPESDLPDGQSDTCFVFYSGNASFYEASVRMVPYKLFGGPRFSEWKKRFTRGLVRFFFRRKFIQNLVSELYGIVVILGKPKSRGSLSLRSRDAADTARIDPAFLSHPDDIRTMVAGVRRARQIAESEALTEWGNRPLSPKGKLASDEAIARWIRKNVITTYHYAGTCRMGEDDASVVDCKGRLRGVSGVRVADASIIPWTPVSALNAPSMMIGHRVATWALEDAEDTNAT
jgi:choline dehydrogenase